MAIAFEGYVNPVVGAGWSRFLPYQLMERDIVHKPYKPTLASGGRRKVDVGCLTCHVLTCCYTTYGFVQCLASIAAADGDWAVEVLTERFEDVDAELLEIADYFE